MTFVIRLAHPEGLSARADEATTVAMASAAMQGQVVVEKYLEWSDPDARGGYGDARWTDDPEKALRFESAWDAHCCWTAQSKKRPLRDDGQPNKPLTAFTVSVEEVPS